ncbi:hypothetical protein CHS0354_027855 [Potamilus streckersoni]|uniref:Ataxin-10 n=1 Tax=Potamilus streckersoni TaxID=2493646 RepID=A0AAE0W5X6_9BIVA|nr:hypothetical protein CHS0354_027855 [Potamilus streckersoni]
MELKEDSLTCARRKLHESIRQKDLNCESLNETLKIILHEINQCADSYECDSEFLEDLHSLLENCLTANFPQPGHCGEIQCATEAFRIFRNSCGMCVNNQSIIRMESKIPLTTHRLVCKLRDSQDGEKDCCVNVLVRCLVQFLGNYCAGNKENSGEMWNLFQDTFMYLLNFKDDKVISYTCMVLHTCLSGKDGLGTIRAHQYSDILHKVISYSTKQETEWGLYVIEDALMMPWFLDDIEKSLSLEQLLLVNEVLLNMLNVLKENDELNIRAPAIENLRVVMKNFKTSAYKILVLGVPNADDSQQMVLYTVKQLEILCLVMSHPGLYKSLQEDVDLVTCAVYLLQSISELGKEGDNSFSAVEKMSQDHLVDMQHPSYGLKKDLIRLIANLAYKNKTNQDKVRELRGIPLILDLTKLDQRNPFITQWAVFAIHNLCEGNNNNKAVLAGIKMEGLADNVHLLQEFGVNAELVGEKIVVKPDPNKEDS